MLTTSRKLSSHPLHLRLEGVINWKYRALCPLDSSGCCTTLPKVCALESLEDFVKLPECYDLGMKCHELKTLSLAGAVLRSDWTDPGRHFINTVLCCDGSFSLSLESTGRHTSPYVCEDFGTGHQTMHWWKQFYSRWNQVCRDLICHLGQDIVGPVPQQRDFSTKDWASDINQGLSLREEQRNHWIHDGLYAFTMAHVHGALYI